MMADALKRGRQAGRVVMLPSEDHWLSRGATRLQMLQATMAFVRSTTRPTEPAAPSDPGALSRSTCAAS